VYKQELKIDPKYAIRVTVAPRALTHVTDLPSLEGEPPVITIEIVNQAGVPIPLDEPLLLFRARDRYALEGALEPYRAYCQKHGCTQYHLDGITNRIDSFEKFAEEHAERMKQPGITLGR